MAKFITNNSRGVISLGAKNFIPGADPVEVTDDEAAHPMIVAYIEDGKLGLADDSAKTSKKTAKSAE